MSPGSPVAPAVVASARSRVGRLVAGPVRRVRGLRRTPPTIPTIPATPSTSVRPVRPRVTVPLGGGAAVSGTGRGPLVTPLGRDGWLVRRRTPQGRGWRAEQVDGRTWLVRRRGRDNQLGLLRHLGEEHVVRTLRRLRVDVVLDVGANRGQFATALRRHGWTGRIVSFEPVPATAGLLERAAADDPEWRVRRLALGESDTTMEIHVGVGQGRLSSLLPASEFGREWNPRIDSDTTVEVAVRRLDGLWDELLEGLDRPRVYLKLDTQGFDLPAFRGAGDRVADLVGMQSEVSLVPLYDGMPHVTEQLSVYEQAGFAITGLFPVVVDRPTMRVIELDAVLVRPEAFREA